MKGTRPLDNDEIRSVSTCFTGTFEVRNRGLFMLGVSTGGRISELLSLQIGDVWQNQNPVSDLLYDKSIVKGGEVSRAVPVNRNGRRLRIWNYVEGIIGGNMEFLSLFSLSVNMPFKSQNVRSGLVDIENEKGHVQLPILFDSRLHLVKYKSETFITGFYVDISYQAFNLKNVGMIPGWDNYWKQLPYYVLYCTPPEDLGKQGNPMFKWHNIKYVQYPRRIIRDIFVSWKNYGKLIKIKPIAEEALIELGLRKSYPDSQ